MNFNYVKRYFQQFGMEFPAGELASQGKSAFNINYLMRECLDSGIPYGAEEEVEEKPVKKTVRRSSKKDEAVAENADNTQEA